MLRISQGSIAVNAKAVSLNLGGLYQYPYSVLLRKDDYKANGIVIEQYAPFALLEFIDASIGKYLRILTATGDIGIVQYSPRYLKKI